MALSTCSCTTPMRGRVSTPARRRSGVLTLPRIGVVQEQVLNAIAGTPYYTQLAAE